MAKYVQEKNISNTDGKSKEDKPSESKSAEKNEMSKDDIAYLNSLRFNVNVFLPDIQTLEGIDNDAFEQIKKDEEMVRNAAEYLWDDIIPGVTREIRLATVHTVPHDGKSLTEFIHQRGINCRYLGRLAKLAQAEEEKELSGLTLFQSVQEEAVTNIPLRSRHDVWTEIEDEIGSRFRYNLTIFNRVGPNDRTPYIPLLRRVCQRNGIRLAAKFYDVGSKCLCSDPGSGGPVIFSYPISALDIIDIVPLMKHAAAHSEGFVACSVVPTSGLPALHISLPDARATLESAYLYHNKKMLSRALDLAQEAAMLYQRVCDTPAHPGVVRCIDLMGSILYDAGEPAVAAANAGRALGFQTQIS